MDENVYKTMLNGFDEMEVEFFDSEKKLIGKQTINQEYLKKVHDSWLPVIEPENPRPFIYDVIDDIMQKAKDATN